MGVIYCFSGTGNSLYIANQLGQKIGAEVKPMTQDRASTSEEQIGFVFPAYFWGMPHRVEEFASRLDIANPNAYLFAVVSYGGMIFGISGMLDDVLAKKGRHLNYAENVKCVENYIPGYCVNDKASIHEHVDERIATIAQNLLAHKEKKAQRASFLNRGIQRLFPREEGRCDTYFSVSDKCISCGVCERGCPAHNISMQDRKPSFHHQCEHCLACVHLCPTQAINWKKGTVGKERYFHPQIQMGEWAAFWQENKETGNK